MIKWVFCASETNWCDTDETLCQSLIFCFCHITLKAPAPSVLIGISRFMFGVERQIICCCKIVGRTQCTVFFDMKVYNACRVCVCDMCFFLFSTELRDYVSWPIFPIIRSAHSEIIQKQRRNSVAEFSQPARKWKKQEITKATRGNVLRLRKYCISGLRMSAFIWDAYFMLCQAVYGCLWPPPSLFPFYLCLCYSLSLSLSFHIF